MIELLKHPLESGILVALVLYVLVLAWLALARLGWLPAAARRSARRLADRLGGVPVLGGVVRAVRRRPLALGWLPALAAGLAVPLAAVSLAFLAVALAFMAVMYVAIRYGSEEGETEKQGDSVYGDPRDLSSYDYDWMASQGKLPRA